jgi:hypothetical protein
MNQIFVIESISHKVEAFYGEVGRMPTAIYLGRCEWEHLRVFASMTGVLFTEFQEANIPEYKGIKVYKIEVESYLGVGI